MAVYPSAPGNSKIKRFIQAKKRVLAPNKVTDLASPNSPRTVKAGKGVGKSPKTSTKAGAKTTDRTPRKAARVSKAKLNTTKKTPFNRSSRVNYRQLRGK